MGKGDIRSRRGKIYRGTHGNARSRLARGGTLEDVPGLGQVVLDGTRQVGVAGAGRCHALVLRRITGFDG